MRGGCRIATLVAVHRRACTSRPWKLSFYSRPWETVCATPTPWPGGVVPVASGLMLSYEMHTCDFCMPSSPGDAPRCITCFTIMNTHVCYQPTVLRQTLPARLRRCIGTGLIRPFGIRILPLLPFTGFCSRLRRKQTTPSIALSPP